ncbi:unnamed protein product [Prorocentrum cordatum]|uniref:HEAT repeat domain-containing protein n=1 Tax=Prorocentrum cordatum TaxID=2364126 RepID=A0ABN9TFC2_9DINO|nr:unnamed protein product [Polarella glacialis]
MGAPLSCPWRADGPTGARAAPRAASAARGDTVCLQNHLQALRGDDRYNEFGILRVKEWGERERAARALGELGDAEAVPGLLEALRGDADSKVRQAAAEALGELGAAEAAPGLLEALRGDADFDPRRLWGGPYPPDLYNLGPRLRLPDVRLAAARALVKLGAAEAVPRLLEAMRGDADEHARHLAAEAFEELGAAEAAPGLLEALRGDADSSVRQLAARALGKLGAAEAAPGLLEALLGDADSEVRLAAAAVLGELGALRSDRSCFKTGDTYACSNYDIKIVFLL